MSLGRQRTQPEKSDLFNIVLKISVGEIKNESKDGFFLAGRSVGLPTLGGGAELRHFVGNGFELRHRAVPEKYKVEISGVFRPIFLWLRGAQARCSWGEKLLEQPLAAPFWILAATCGF